MIFLKVMLPKSDGKTDREQEKEIAKLNEKLGNWEQIKKIELTPDVWSVGNGMLTPTMKLRRKIIKEKYIDLYNKLYEKEA